MDITVQISYHQKLFGYRAEYILETTQIWKKPMQKATYQLIVPADIFITDFSILPMDSIKTEKEKISTWEMLDFMPMGNLIIDFVVK